MALCLDLLEVCMPSGQSASAFQKLAQIRQRSDRLFDRTAIVYGLNVERLTGEMA